MKVRLTDWATRQGISCTTAFSWAKAGKISGLHQAVSGRLFVEVSPIVDEGEERLALAQDLVDVVTSMCARIYGRRSASNRAKRALVAAEAGQ